MNTYKKIITRLKHDKIRADHVEEMERLEFESGGCVLSEKGKKAQQMRVLLEVYDNYWGYDLLPSEVKQKYGIK